MNKNSSRSHCIFTIYVEARSRTLSDEKYVTSKINLVDLAGSERLGKSRVSGGAGSSSSTSHGPVSSFVSVYVDCPSLGICEQCS